MSVLERADFVNGSLLNYAAAGSGPVNVLCFPGPLGTWQSDFEYQLKSFDGDKFSVVAMDAPGYGKSRPPDRSFNLATHAADADAGHQLMQVRQASAGRRDTMGGSLRQLGRVPYSILGWSDGGRSALFAAHMQPTAVERLVIWGTTVNVQLYMIRQLQAAAELDAWFPVKRNLLTSIYGETYLQKLWKDYVAFTNKIYKEEKSGNICRHLLAQIEQRTLILHGKENKDKQMPLYYPKSIEQQMPNAKLKTHDRRALEIHSFDDDDDQWFKETVESFLIDEDDSFWNAL